MMAKYIDADKLRENVNVWLDGNVLVMPVSALDEAPTENVEEVRYGEWKYDHWCEFKCSICGHWSQTEPRGKEKYCPHCGAKMDGKEDKYPSVPDNYNFEVGE